MRILTPITEEQIIREFSIFFG